MTRGSVGSVWVENAGAWVGRSTIVSEGCVPALTINAGDVGRANPLEQGMTVNSSVVRSTIVGQPAILYQGASDVFDSLFVQRSLALTGLVLVPISMELTLRGLKYLSSAEVGLISLLETYRKLENANH